MELTLIIPTLNRPELLKRELHYYQTTQFNGKILIGDSSDNPTARALTQELGAFKGPFQIEYHYLPNRHPAQVVSLLAEKVTTRYVTFIADDDFLVPSALAKCVDFLEANPDYAAAHGLGVTLNAYSSAADDVDYAIFYQQPISTAATAAERLRAHLTDYSVSLFAVHRLEAWRAMFQDVDHLADKTFGAELLPCCLSVVFGKVKQLDDLYLIRQHHPKRYHLPQWFEWITTENWRNSYLLFRDLLAQAIARQDGIDLEAAQLVVTEAFSTYLAQSISGTPPGILHFKERDLIKHPAASVQPGLRQSLKRLPGAQKAWQIWKTMRSRTVSAKKAGTAAEIADSNARKNIEELNSLSILLDPALPYYPDFKPIFEAVTRPPASQS